MWADYPNPNPSHTHLSWSMLLGHVMCLCWVWQ